MPRIKRINAGLTDVVRFLIDQQLPPALAGFFESADMKVGIWRRSHGFELRYRSIRIRIAGQQIIVTKDEDFFYLSRRFGSDVRLLWVRLGTAAPQYC